MLHPEAMGTLSGVCIDGYDGEDPTFIQLGASIVHFNGPDPSGRYQMDIKELG